jgi:hypothetical protein
MRRSETGELKLPTKEQDCPGCKGTGFTAVKQPKEPGPNFSTTMLEMPRQGQRAIGSRPSGVWV